MDNITCHGFYKEETRARYWVTFVPKAYRPTVICPNGDGAAQESTFVFAQKESFALVINAGLYDSDAFGKTNKPEGIVICNGIIVQNKPVITHPRSIPLCFDENGNLGHVPYDADANFLVLNHVKNAVCGFMPIVIDGKKANEDEWPVVQHFGMPHARQVIGQYPSGDFCVITTEGVPKTDDPTGFTIKEVQEICLEQGLQYAYNLDGGTSTATVVDGKQINPFYKTEYGRIVPTYIGFVPKNMQPTTD